MGNLGILEDACEKLPHTTRAMFGGHGLFAPNGGMFAGIVTDDAIILKLPVAAPEYAQFLGTGAAPWVYKSKSGEMTMKEWLVVPDEMMDEPHALSAWAAKAHRLAPAKKGKSPTRKAMPSPPKKAEATKSARKKSSSKAAKAPAARKTRAAKRPR